ncbi:hypothetical protein PG996_004487 [Apiospora saccharicola]|uniref:RNase III domain-containing protein n=1 Tax=Apiospora saccharicola TaxID=335842 RepID=A0ABR1W4A1_9PEZI
MGPGAVLGKRAAKRAARALAAQVEAKEKASLAQASLPPLKLPPWNKKIRISSQPLHRYAFFTPSSPLICSWIQPTRRDRLFGPGVTRCEVGKTTDTRFLFLLALCFKSKVLLAEALTVELNSTPAGQFKLGTSHFYLPPNKRLALYGDSILRTYLARKWLELGPSGTGQLWSVTSSDVLSDQNFGRIYLKLGLNLCVTSEPPNDGKLNPEKDKLPKHMATTMEAIVAAAFVDGGDEALEIVLKRMGMDQHFREEPATQYDFFRHGRPPSEDSPLPSAPSPVPKPAETRTADGPESGNGKARRFTWLQKSVVFAFLLVFVACIAGLIFLHSFALQQDGLQLRWHDNHHLWTYEPPAILAVILSLWRRVDSIYRLNQPWWCLFAGPAPASESVLLDYITSPFIGVILFRALRLRHYPVAASVLGFVLLKLIHPRPHRGLLRGAVVEIRDGNDWDWDYQMQAGELKARFLGSDKPSWSYLAGLDKVAISAGDTETAIDLILPDVTYEPATLVNDVQNLGVGERKTLAVSNRIRHLRNQQPGPSGKSNSRQKT